MTSPVIFSFLPVVSMDAETDIGDLIAIDPFTADDLQLATETGLALLKQRITVKHQRADGTLLSRYSNKPISVPLKGIGTGSPKMKPKGGTVRKFKSGKKKGKRSKHMRFKKGYKQMRGLAGRSTDKDFMASGNTMGKRLRVLRVRGNTAIVGWPPGSTQGRVATYLDKQEKDQAFAWARDEEDAIQEAAQFIIDAKYAAVGAADVPSKPVVMVQIEKKKKKIKK